ncbi:MAG: HNH endonuclease signature motif containing protein [Prochlorotrichaceae cyanobacterium]
MNNSPPADRCLRLYKRQGYYPGPWNKGRIQKVMRKWAGDTCENCGATNTPLDCHHIVWKARHDCRWENLVVVCDRCHAKIHRHKWEPGKPWTLSKTPQWMTSRGYVNPAQTGTTKETLDRGIESAQKRLKLGQALQGRGANLLRGEITPDTLREAATAIEKGIKLEYESRESLLKSRELWADNDRFNYWIQEAIDSCKRHSTLASALQKHGLDMAMDGSVRIAAIVLDKGAALEQRSEEQAFKFSTLSTEAQP